MSRKKKQKYTEVEYYSLSPETKKGIVIVALFAFAVICILSFLGIAGRAGFYLDMGMGIAFGWGRYLFPILLMLIGYMMARPSRYKISISNYVGIFIFLLSVLGLMHLKMPISGSFDLNFDGIGGGVVGYLVLFPLNLYLGFWGALSILIALFMAALLLMFNTGFELLLEKLNIIKHISPFKKQGDSDAADEEDDDEEEEEEEIEEDSENQATEVKFSRRGVLTEESAPVGRTKIKTPKVRIDLPLTLLDSKISKPTSGDIKVGRERIQKTLENFNIDVEMDDVQVGPTVTQYTFKPAEGIKLSRITTLSNDLALSLAAHPIRIEAPIPGKSLVGIEVPNKKPAIVRVREILESPEFKQRKNNLTIALGKDVSGKCWVSDIASMPHLLVAGATGSGKSVCLNTIIISLLYQNNPDTLRMLLVDPKRVEFPIYNGIPHLLAPVITDVTKTVYALRWAITEMDQRFDILSKANKRNIEAYNQTAKEKMPYIVIIIDELADLMVAASAEVEGSIIRLTQMARAVGIHLIVATQRPSVDVITGLIKANIPCRIAFSVASLMDSRTILDSSGAEKLVGKGDMLFMTPQASTPRRLQGTYLSDDETKKVVSFLKDAFGEEPDYNDEIVNKQSSASSFDFQGGNNDNGDDLFEEAKDVVLRSGKASASLLQRRLRVGYARAARLIDLLEDAGIVGPADGARPREILMDRNSIQNSKPTAPPHSFEEDNDEENEEDDSDDFEEEPPKKTNSFPNESDDDEIY
ncbi:DNA translocase FtsK [Patescibacteria group bacterium]|nr:DNA translocase FtsK [Patescibacteria group bacterium]